MGTLAKLIEKKAALLAMVDKIELAIKELQPAKIVMPQIEKPTKKPVDKAV